MNAENNINATDRDHESDNKHHHANKDGYQCLMKLASVLDSARDQNQRFDSTFMSFGFMTRNGQIVSFSFFGSVGISGHVCVFFV